MEINFGKIEINEDPINDMIKIYFLFSFLYVQINRAIIPKNNPKKT